MGISSGIMIWTRLGERISNHFSESKNSIALKSYRIFLILEAQRTDCAVVTLQILEFQFSKYILIII